MPARLRLKLPAGPESAILARAYPERFSLRRGNAVSSRVGGGKGFEARLRGQELSIHAATRSDYFRALGQCLAFPGRKQWSGQAPIEFRGLMIDASRNGVLRPSYLKALIPQLAFLGLNALCLYTEDTFEVPGHPLIGYRRGAYTQEELRDLDRFAAGFGIEMFPCIQTLGHLEQILKYPRYAPLQDNAAVLNGSLPQAKAFLKDLIRAASAPYASKRIHVGLDETWGLGLGARFRPGTTPRPLTLYLDHLRQVDRICSELGLSPMIWGDMIQGSSGGGAMSSAQKKSVPARMEVVHWSYYKEERSEYRKEIAGFRRAGIEPLVAPGLINWGRFWGLYPKSKHAMQPLMLEAKAAGLRGAMITSWGNDGQEAPFSSNLPALALYAEHCWVQRPSSKAHEALLLAVGKDPLASFEAAAAMDALGPAMVRVRANPAKCFLFDDPLLRLYASHWGHRRWGPHYQTLWLRLKRVREMAHRDNRLLFDFALALADYLRLKADFGNHLYEAYRGAERGRLRTLRGQVPVLVRRLQALWRAHRALWLSQNKPQGFEVLDQRYGGSRQRLLACQQSLNLYLRGQAPGIAELEDAPQRFLPSFPRHQLTFKQLSSPSVIQ